MSFSADKKPTARDFQQVALRCVTQAIQLPDMNMEDLEASDPVRGVIPKTEEPVEVMASKWIVTEKSPKYPDEVSAQQAVAAAIESAVMLLPIEQLSTCEIEFSGQRITDIRYRAADGDYRVRVYSPFGKKIVSKNISPSTQSLPKLVTDNLAIIQRDPEINATPSSGVMVCIEKLSKDNVATATGTVDETSTFVTYRIQTTEQEISPRGLAVLIAKITYGISEQLGQIPYNIQNKVRYGAKLTIPHQDSDPKERKNEMVYAAIDTRRRVYNLQEVSIPEVNLLQLWQDIRPNQLETHVDAEIEVNNTSWAIIGNKQLQSSPRVSEIIEAFIEGSVR